RHLSQSSPAPSVTPNRRVNQADSGASQPANEASAFGWRAVELKNREQRQSRQLPDEEESDRRGQGQAHSRYASSRPVPNQSFIRTSMTPISPDDMLSASRRSSIWNGDVVQLLQLEERLMAQADELREAAKQLALLRASMAWRN